MTIALGSRRIARSATFSNLLLWAAASLPLTLLVLLFVALFTLSPARAETLTCAGRNILTELAAKPDKKKQVEAEAAAIPNGRGILWKIEKQGVSPSYLSLIHI